MAQTQLTVPVRDGYNFGIGADLLSGAPLNQPVRNDVINSVAGAEGATVDFVIQRCQSTHDLEQTLGISAEASCGCASFGAGVSDRFKFAMSAKIQSSSLFMTITATVKLKVLSIDAPALTPEAIKLLDHLYAVRLVNGDQRGACRVSHHRHHLGGGGRADRYGHHRQ